MNISKQSWHYRLMNCRLFSWVPALDLCTYMRRLVLSLIVVGILIPAAIVGIIQIPIFFFMGPEIVALLSDISLVVEITLIWTMIFGIIAWLMGIIYCLIMLSNTIVKWMGQRSDGRSQRSLLGEWLKAHKDKICPVIQYTKE